MNYASMTWHEKWIIQHAMIQHKHKPQQSSMSKKLKQEHLKQELSKIFYTARINHKINFEYRGHQNKLMRVGFAAKLFF